MGLLLVSSSTPDMGKREYRLPPCLLNRRASVVPAATAPTPTTPIRAALIVVAGAAALGSGSAANAAKAALCKSGSRHVTASSIPVDDTVRYLATRVAVRQREAESKRPYPAYLMPVPGVAIDSMSDSSSAWRFTRKEMLLPGCQPSI